MSTVPNYAGAFLSNAPPMCSNYAAIGSPWGTFVKPGGRIAAYVRSTGPQDGDDTFMSSGMLVTSLNEGLKRCRAGQGDIVYVLPGHAETISTNTGFPNLVSGTQIIGCGAAGASNAPTLTLAALTGGIVMNAADVTMAGLNFRTLGITAAVVVITASGVTLAGNSFISTGTATNAVISVLANSALANVTIVGNSIIADTGALALIAIGGAVGASNFVIAGNTGRQIGTGAMVSVSNVAHTGHIANNFFKTAAVTTAGVGVITIGAAAATLVGNHENYGCDETAAGGLLATGA